MSLDFSKTKSLTIPEGKVKKIEDSNGVTIWKGTWKYTINIGYYVTSIRYKINSGAWVVHQKSTSASLTIEIDSGATLNIEAYEYTSKSSTYKYNYTMTDYNFNVTKTEANDGGSITVYRTATPVDRYYTITWVNYNGSVLETDTVIHDATPTYDGAEPVKPSDNTYSYSFSGWSPSVSTVTGDATYTAQFNPSYIPYTITWEWEDSYGNLTTTTTTYRYEDIPGTSTPLSGTVPSPVDVTSGNNKHVYTGWDSLAQVIESRTIKATYQQQYQIEIGRIRCTCPSSDGWYNAGDYITFTANSNCAFSLDGSQTIYEPQINSGGYYEGSADFVNCTPSGNNSYQNKTGWMAYGETITWTAIFPYAFDHYNTTTVTAGAVPGVLRINADYYRNFTLTLASTYGHWVDGSGNTVTSISNVDYATSCSAGGIVLTVGSSMYRFIIDSDTIEYDYEFSTITGVPSTVVEDTTITGYASRSYRNYTIQQYSITGGTVYWSTSQITTSGGTTTLSANYNSTVYWRIEANVGYVLPNTYYGYFTVDNNNFSFNTSNNTAAYIGSAISDCIYTTYTITLSSSNGYWKNSSGSTITSIPNVPHNTSASKSGTTLTIGSNNYYFYKNEDTVYYRYTNPTIGTVPSTITSNTTISGSATRSDRYYWVYIYNDNSGYDINCGSTVIPADDFITYGSYTYGTSVTIPSCTPQASPYTASGSKTITVTDDVYLHLNVRYQSAGMTETHEISYFGATYISQSYRGGPGSAIWGNDAGGYNPLPSSGDTHIQLYYSGTTYIAQIPSDVKTMDYYWGDNDNYGPYTATCTVGSGTIAWYINAYCDEDTDVEVYVTLKNKGSGTNYNNFTRSKCLYGKYVTASYVCYWV